MRIGHPALTPRYNYSYELSCMMKIGKRTLTPNVYISHTTDNTQRYQSVDESGVIVSKPINIGTDERYGGDLTMMIRPFSRWNLMGNVNLYRYTTRGEYTDSYLSADGEMYSSSTSIDEDGFSLIGRLSCVYSLP